MCTGLLPPGANPIAVKILIIIANLGSFRILLHFFRTSWGVCILNSAIFNSFHKSGWVWHDFGGPSEFRGGFQHPKPPLPRYATGPQPAQQNVSVGRDITTYSGLCARFTEAVRQGHKATARLICFTNWRRVMSQDPLLPSSEVLTVRERQERQQMPTKPHDVKPIPTVSARMERNSYAWRNNVLICKLGKILGVQQ